MVGVIARLTNAARIPTYVYGANRTRVWRPHANSWRGVQSACIEGIARQCPQAYSHPTPQGKDTDMEKLTELTDEQWKMMYAYRDELLEMGRATGRVERSNAETALVTVYQERNLTPPDMVLWARSPQEGCVMAAILQLLDGFDTDKALKSTGSGTSKKEGCKADAEKIAKLFKDEVVRVEQFKDHEKRHETWALMAQQMCAWELSDANQSGQFVAAMEKAIGERVDQGSSLDVTGQLNAACYGPHDLYWLGFYQFLKNLGLESEADPGPQIELARNCGWWWPFENVCILSEHPSWLSLDDEGRMHGEKRAATQYPDGWGVYSWRGTRIPANWIEQPETLTPEMAITWDNAEQRRCAAEIIGWDKILTHLNAVCINEDPDPQIGKLMQVDLPDSPGERFLKVECGTGRTFALPVPPDTETALAAQSWMHGGVDVDIIKSLEIRT